MRLTGSVVCIPPDADLYKYSGTISCMNRKVMLGEKQLLLRGARLKNTKWIVGIVNYTGMDTKIMKNADSAKYKQSNIERISNVLIIIILIFQLIVSAISAIGNSIWNSSYSSQHYYLYFKFSYEVEGFLTFLTYLVLNNTMIPISLIVSLEIVKAIQGYII